MNNHGKPTLGWTIDIDHDPMTVVVYDVMNREPLMKFFLGEAMELAGRFPVMRHISEIEHSKWIRRWHGDDDAASYKVNHLEFRWYPHQKDKKTIDVLHTKSGKILMSYPFDSSKNTVDQIVTRFLRFIGES